LRHLHILVAGQDPHLFHSDYNIGVCHAGVWSCPYKATRNCSTGAVWISGIER
jgi:hypothetical protein